MELSRPTVNGNTAWGNKTVSRTGKTGTALDGATLEGSNPGLELEEELIIEHPRINFSY
jgi:hypothetical protein